MIKKNTIRSKIIVLFILVSLISCNKDEEVRNQTPIPNVPVNFYIQPNTIDFIAAGMWSSYDEQGYRGVLIYRLDQYTFLAYEKTCPYDPEELCAKVEVDQATFTLLDSCCMSRYNIIDGAPVEGPASMPLLQYFTDFDGNYLHVYNGN